MSDYDIHSCGYYCDRPACIEAQRNELRDKLFSEQAVKAYSGGKPNYTQPDEAMIKKVMDRIPDMPIRAKIEKEPMIDNWPLYSGLPQPEPIAYINVETRNLSWAKPTRWETPTVVKMDKVPLYTAPPKKKWVGLTDKEVEKIFCTHGVMSPSGWPLPHGMAREIEAKLREKNG